MPDPKLICPACGVPAVHGRTALVTTLACRCQQLRRSNLALRQQLDQADADRADHRRLLRIATVEIERTADTLEALNDQVEALTAERDALRLDLDLAERELATLRARLQLALGSG